MINPKHDVGGTMKNLPEFEGSMLEAFADTSLGNLHTIEKDGKMYVPAHRRGIHAVDLR